MADYDKDQKTESPTGKRLEDAFGRGQFAKSPEIQLAFVLAALLGVLAFTVTETAKDLSAFSTGIFSQIGTLHLQMETMPSQVASLVLLLGKLLLPVMGAVTMAILLSGGLQSGFRITPEVIGLHFNALNPMSGFSRIFSKNSTVNSGIDLLKMIAIGLSLWVGLRGLMQDPIF